MPALSDGTAQAELDAQTPARRALSAVPDRAAREAAAAVARLEFCEHLKDIRQRRGVTLAEIAERSKVNEGLYAALERGDVSRWPTGIYRRAFFRAYALAIGVPVDAALSDFVRLFPEDGDQRVSPALSAPAGPMRMTLAGRTWMRMSRVHVMAALVDLVIVGAIAAALAWWMPVGISTVTAVVAVVYYSLATACLACSPGAWWLRTRVNRKRARALRLAR
jgi:transcriptional regulator with XRE-family HTH domain